MEAIDAVLSMYQPFIDRSTKGPNAVSEDNTIFPRFDENTISTICAEATKVIMPMGSLIAVQPPIVYVGDIHGNLTDLIRILHIFGMPPNTRYLFLGDYVDRGSHSIEVITILLALLCKFPNDVFLIRGNHEFASVNRMYGFYDETLNSYGTEDVWLTCNNVFGYLPFAAVVGDQVFCVHGGLSPQLESTNTINDIDQPVGLYEETEIISDLVWSDPVDEITGYEQNKRGCGVLYGPGAVATFLKNNKLKVVLRAHQCVATGYCLNCNNMCITLFSSSNYCRMLQNKCGVIVHKDNRELSFYSLNDDADVGVKPKMTMSVPNTAALGLKQVAASKANSNSGPRGKTPSRMPSNIPKIPTGRSSICSTSGPLSSRPKTNLSTNNLPTSISQRSNSKLSSIPRSDAKERRASQLISKRSSQQSFSSTTRNFKGRTTLIKS